MIAIVIFVGYILGSLPVAYVVARVWGINILEVDTRNPGAANVFRQVGPLPGAIVFCGDIAKGAFAVLLARWLGPSDWIALAAGGAALVGHWFPVFLGFRGGMGLDTSMGIAYGIMPIPATIALPIGFAALRITRSSTHTVGSAFAGFFVAALALGHSPSLVLAVVAIPFLIIPRRYLLPRLVARVRVLLQ